MYARVVSVFVTSLALALLWGQAGLTQDDKAHEGKVVKAAQGKLTMTFKGEAKKHTHDVDPKAKITLDEKAARLEDLKEGFHVKVWMNAKHALTKIEAHSQKKKE